MPPTFYSSYLGSKMLAHDLYPLGFGSRADRVARTRAAAARAVAPEVLAELRAQNAGLPPSPMRERNLEALGNHAAAVITGQQVGLFLGPLYTLYKAASAIATARLLEAEAGVRVVPIFWLQTEDHDFAEIAHCTVPRADGVATRVELPAGDRLPARASIAARVLSDDVAGALDVLAEALAGQPHADEVIALLGQHYRAGVTWARAFAGVLAQLFADEGLIIFDPRNETIAKLAAPVIGKALVEHDAVEKALLDRAQLLSSLGLDEQVKARPGMPLPFFHLGDRLGPRHRLRCCESGFLVENAELVLTRDALVETLHADPLRFSTSALLRPLLQDTLLPTAAYVGGPAEVNYFAQIAPLYAVFNLQPPLLTPRARFRLVPAPLRKLLGELQLQPEDVEQPEAALLERLAHHDGADGPNRKWLAELETKLDAMLTAQPAAPPQLLRAVERTRATVVRAVARLERKHDRLRLDRDATATARVEKLQRWLHPAGEPQERVHAAWHYAARVGSQPLVAAILNTLDPLQPAPRDIEL